MMKRLKNSVLFLLIAIFLVQCRPVQGDLNQDEVPDYSGIYCLNMQNLEMTITQTGSSVTFSLQSDLLTDGMGTISGDILQLTAVTTGAANFSANLAFMEAGARFSGPFEIKDATGITLMDGILLGDKGECPEYDITVNGVPRFVSADFTELAKIEQISKFRSGFGHSYTDGFETCRSMKHYYNPYEMYRQNQTVEIYAPVTGIITSISDDGHGASLGLTNKQIQIRPEAQPAFTFVLFHTDLASVEIVTGKQIKAGELLGYARLYYEDLDEHATSFDIAVWVNTPSGSRLVSYFDTLADGVFDAYISRGATSRQDFIITQAERDTDPLECSGEAFITSDGLVNWVILR